MEVLEDIVVVILSRLHGVSILIPCTLSFIPILIKICPVVLQQKHADRHDHPYMHSCYAHCAQNT
jgi:hypothetical protein